MNVRFLCKFSEKGAEKFTAMYPPTENIFNARNMKGEIINESFLTEKSDIRYFRFGAYFRYCFKRVTLGYCR